MAGFVWGFPELCYLHCRKRQEQQYLPKPSEEMEAIRIAKWSVWEEARERRLPVH